MGRISRLIKRGVVANMAGAQLFESGEGGTPPGPEPSGPIFSLDALNSLTPEIAEGDGTPAFSRASIATFRDDLGIIKSASSGAERFWASNGYLSEGARNNTISYSQEFDNVAWAGSNDLVVPNDTVAPNGAMDADRINDDSAGGTGAVYVWRGNEPPGAVSGENVFSVFLKAGSYAFARLFIGSLASGNLHCNFDLTNGATNIGQVGNTLSVGTENYGNGWWRCWIHYTDTNTSVIPRIFPAPSLTSNTVNLDGTSNIYAWGAQLEPGDFPSTFIPTGAAPVSRAADSLAYQTAGNV